MMNIEQVIYQSAQHLVIITPDPRRNKILKRANTNCNRRPFGINEYDPQALNRQKKERERAGEVRPSSLRLKMKNFFIYYPRHDSGLHNSIMSLT